MNHMASSLRAITRYHKIKMDEVNKIVQELWIKIYRGGGENNSDTGCLAEVKKLEAVVFYEDNELQWVEEL